jgi:transcriptional regulator with XRE-family HTH domain
MTVADIYENRVLTAEELGPVIKALREEQKWTQATLAELSGLTERTVQRVEKGESASHDTRRALARGIGFDDLDVFNKPFPVLNEEKYKAYLAELDRSTVVVDLALADRARIARIMVEGADSSMHEYVGEPAREARDAFAALVDNLRDYNDVRDCYSETQRLEIDDSLDSLITEITEHGCAVGVGLRRATVSFSNDPPNTKPMDWTNVFFILAPADQLPSKIRVPKSPAMGDPEYSNNRGKPRSDFKIASDPQSGPGSRR